MKNLRNFYALAAIPSLFLLLGSFLFRPGEKVGIVGRSGSGKSSLLRALADLHRAKARCSSMEK